MVQVFTCYDNLYQSLKTEKATISKLVVHISLCFFHVRPFIKIDEPQDKNEGNRKIQIFTTNVKKKRKREPSTTLQII